MNTTVIFRYSSSGKVVYITPEETLQEFGKDKTNILDATLASTIELIKEDSGSFFKSLVNRQIQLRITDSFSGTASLLPLVILLNA
jgi:predicted ATP-dependent serine protease